jgi:transcriptional regulator with XRE-family HTH domain
MTFGAKLKELRIRKRMTLRDCCIELGVDASNWSKLERDVNPAPKDIEILEAWAEFFGVSGREKQELFDFAALSRKQIPEDIASNERLMEKLPAFFRVVRGKELEGDKLKRFIEDLRKVHSPAGDSGRE